jgi:hypothetical protein
MYHAKQMCVRAHESIFFVYADDHTQLRLRPFTLMLLNGHTVFEQRQSALQDNWGTILILKLS